MKKMSSAGFFGFRIKKLFIALTQIIFQIYKVWKDHKPWQKQLIWRFMQIK